MYHSKEWFYKRIGKRIFRDPATCKCYQCQKIEKKGVKIINKSHADYLYTIQNEFGSEGINLNYRDKQ